MSLLSTFLLAGGALQPSAGATLQAAIEAYWATRPDLQALTSDGLLWHTEAEEGTDLPYVEFFKVSEPNDSLTTVFLVPRAKVQFNCYAATDVQAMAIRDALMTGFSRAPLSVNGQAVLHCIPGDPIEDKAEGKGPRGHDCYAAMFTLDVLMTQTF